VCGPECRHHAAQCGRAEMSMTVIGAQRPNFGEYAIAASLQVYVPRGSVSDYIEVHMGYEATQ